MLELRDTEVVICIQLAMLRRANDRHYLNIDSNQSINQSISLNQHLISNIANIMLHHLTKYFSTMC